MWRKYHKEYLQLKKCKYGGALIFNYEENIFDTSQWSSRENSTKWELQLYWQVGAKAELDRNIQIRADIKGIERKWISLMKAIRCCIK